MIKIMKNRHLGLILGICTSGNHKIWKLSGSKCIRNYGIWYLGMHLPKGSSERYNPVLVEGSVVTDEEISTLNLKKVQFTLFFVEILSLSLKTKKIYRTYSCMFCCKKYSTIFIAVLYTCRTFINDSQRRGIIL